MLIIRKTVWKFWNIFFEKMVAFLVSTKIPEKKTGQHASI